ncbi:PilZ domain-containing protein [Croceicoccus ponticola]|uniref:PilZ domain-containing protein n=1 Tax=Croceicoccus ponticola TaxID=2217664 RepID=UPI0013E28865|nr:PilZ domain-containing protein [Croceicoccus ponticola]
MINRHQPDRRSERRSTSVYRPALIQTEHFSGFCMIRDISSAGVNVQAFADIAVGQKVAVEFSDSLRSEGQVIWAKNNLIGIKFHEEIDEDRILCGALQREQEHSDRPLRLDIECDACLSIEGKSIPIRVRDISQRGIKAAASSLSVGDAPVVYLPDLPPKRATVRWTQYGIAGLHFDVPLRYDDLATWAIRLNQDKVD